VTGACWSWEINIDIVTGACWSCEIIPHLKQFNTQNSTPCNVGKYSCLGIGTAVWWG
jgi:hypothetical protein